MCDDLRIRNFAECALHAGILIANLIIVVEEEALDLLS